MQPFPKISQLFLKINGKIIFSGSNVIAIYTALRILKLMQKTLGIEAMLEYLEKSVNYIAQTHPDIASATEEILKIVDLEKIYSEILDNDKEAA